MSKTVKLPHPIKVGVPMIAAWREIAKLLTDRYPTSSALELHGAIAVVNGYLASYGAKDDGDDDHEHTYEDHPQHCDECDHTRDGAELIDFMDNGD
jgi:hypothetical protein